MRQDARRAPMTFLYATESRFLSSTVSSWSDEATRFMFSTISVKDATMHVNWIGEMRGIGQQLFDAALHRQIGRMCGAFKVDIHSPS